MMFQLHPPHIIMNSMRPLHDQSYLKISFVAPKFSTTANPQKWLFNCDFSKL